MELPDFLIKPSILIKDKSLQPLDGDIYGVIYWYTKLKLQRCILSNKAIADLLRCSVSGVAHGISRLCKGKYIQVILDEQNHRLELIPNLSFTPPNLIQNDPMHNSATPMHKRATPHAQVNNAPCSIEQHNNIELKREVNKTTTNVVARSAEKEIGDKRNLEIQEGIDLLRELFGSITKERLNRFALQRLYKNKGKERTLKAMRFAYQMREEEYAPYISNYLDLEEKWDRLEVFGRRITREKQGINKQVRIARMPLKGGGIGG